MNKNVSKRISNNKNVTKGKITEAYNVHDSPCIKPCYGSMLQEAEYARKSDGLPPPFIVCPPASNCPVCQERQRRRDEGLMER